MKITLGQLAGKIQAELRGDPDAEVTGMSGLEDIRPGRIVFLEKKRDAALLQGKSPAAVICSPSSGLQGFNLLVCEQPRLAFIKALRIFFTETRPVPGAHPSASVHPEARVDPAASVGACAVVERGAAVGPGTLVGPCAFVGENAVIGADCTLHPQSAVLRGCRLGDRVVLHSGAVIGADGFGYMPQGAEHIKIPQTGIVVIEDDVEIGANSAVDRATIGETRIGGGTKIDNLVQVGHNCKIGKGVILCGHVGISGSCEIGDNAVLAGQAGVSDHIKIGPRAILGGRAGVISEIPEGKFYSGMPARPHRETMKLYSALNRLPQLEEELQKLREEIEELKKRKP